MIAFAFMLVDAAVRAGIPVPKNPDCFDKTKYPQFEVLCQTQLGRAMVLGEHWENAKRLAEIPVEELKTMAWNQLAEKGVCPYEE